MTEENGVIILSLLSLLLVSYGVFHLRVGGKGELLLNVSLRAAWAMHPDDDQLTPASVCHCSLALLSLSFISVVSACFLIKEEIRSC